MNVQTKVGEGKEEMWCIREANGLGKGVDERRAPQTMENRRSVNMCQRKELPEKMPQRWWNGSQVLKDKGVVVSGSDSRWETVNGENLVETTDMISNNVVAFTRGRINEKGLMDVCCFCLSNTHSPFFWKERLSFLWRPKGYESTLSLGLPVDKSPRPRKWEDSITLTSVIDSIFGQLAPKDAIRIS